MLRRAHGRTHGEGTRNVGNRRGDIREAGEVVVRRFWRFLLERVEIIVLALKIFLVEATQRLAVLAGLMRATMLGKIVGARECFIAERADVWSLLRVSAHVPLEVF